jgi:hypothetical protein
VNCFFLTHSLTYLTRATCAFIKKGTRLARPVAAIKAQRIFMSFIIWNFHNFAAMGTITKTCLMHRTRSNRSVCLNILNKRSIWNKLVRTKRGSCYRRSIMMFEPVQYCGLLIRVTIRVYHRVSQNLLRNWTNWNPHRNRHGLSICDAYCAKLRNRKRNSILNSFKHKREMSEKKNNCYSFLI